MNGEQKLLICGGIAALTFSLALWLFSWWKGRRDKKRDQECQRRFNILHRVKSNKNGKTDSDPEKFIKT